MGQKKTPKVYIIGVGPGSAEWLTAAAEKALRKSDIILAWDWSLRPVKPLVSDKKICFQDTKNYLQVEQDAAELARKSGQTVAVLRVGDPCVSSSLAKLLEVFHDFDIKIIPGVGSVQFAAAAAQICIDESVVVSFHDGRDNLRDDKLGFLSDAFKRKRNLIILSNETQMPPQTAGRLIASGLSENTPIVVCENLTLDEETIFRGTLRDVVNKQFGYTSVLVVKNTSPQN